MEEKRNLVKLLEKIHIDTYYYDEYDELVTRRFEDVIGDLADLWDALNDDYKNKLYEAMGIVPSETKSTLNYPTGERGVFTFPKDTANPMKIKYVDTKDTGIEYLQSQPTYENEVSKYE